MINNQNLAVLSEKVAYLEAALKTAGVLPEVSASDNGSALQVVEGAWAIGDPIPSVVNTLDSTSTTNALSAAQGKILNEKFAVIEASDNTEQSISASIVTDILITEDNLPAGTYLCIVTLSLGSAGSSAITHDMQVRFANAKSIEERIVQSSYSSMTGTYVRTRAFDGNTKGSVQLYDSVATTVTAVSACFIKLT